MYVMALIGLVVIGGCATSPPSEADDEVGLSDCVSEEGQRLLTFCASPQAATLAERQHTMAIADGPDERATDMVSLPVDGAPVRGERDAPITVHLFSDLNCRECRSVYERLAAEVDHRPGQMRLVFRHVPRDSDGEQIARAAIAAGEQGKFFEFVDALYAGDEIAARGQWPEVAESAGLDVEAWQRDRRMPTIDAVLEGDAIQADNAGLVDSPTFFVNGIRHSSSAALQDLDDVIEAEIEDVEAMQEAGLSGADISWRRIMQNYEPIDWEDVDEGRQQLQQQLPVAHIPVGNSPQQGASPDDSLLTAVVFADFSCQYSAESARVWDQLVEIYEERGLRLVFKHFPLSTAEGADMAASASVVAQQGGVFWDFHDALFFEGVDFGAGRLESTLRQLGWSGDDFRGLVEGDEVRGVVADDRRSGEEAGVEGTPTVFINGIRLEGVWTADELAPLVEDQLELGASIRELTGNDGDALYRDIVEANRGQ